MQRLLLLLFRGMLRRAMTMRRTQLEQLPLPPGRLLFLGDSITEQGEWAEWFPELAVLNRGVGRDTVGGVTARLDHAVHAPAAISMIIGTNDLGGLGSSNRVRDVARQMQALVDRLRVLAPDAPLVISSVMPRKRALAEEVRALNAEYRRIAAASGVTYVDVWSALADERGALRRSFTGDDLHLNGAGYRVWVDLLRPHLAPVAPT